MAAKTANSSNITSARFGPSSKPRTTGVDRAKLYKMPAEGRLRLTYLRDRSVHLDAIYAIDSAVNKATGPTVGSHMEDGVWRKIVFLPSQFAWAVSAPACGMIPCYVRHTIPGRRDVDGFAQSVR